MKRLGFKAKKGSSAISRPVNKIKEEAKGILAAAAVALLIFAAPESVYASNPAFKEATDLLTDARAFIFGITTAGAIVGLGFGAFYKFFSMGDHQRIQSGNKIIVGSLVGWGVVNGAFLLFRTLQQYTPGGQVTGV